MKLTDDAVQVNCFLRFSTCLIYQLLRDELKSQTIIMYLSISPCSFISFSLINFDALLLDIYAFRIIMYYSWRMGHLIIMKCLSLSLIFFLILKSALSEINRAFFVLVLTWYLFLHLFIFNLPEALKWFLCRQHMIRSWFFVHFCQSMCFNWYI